MKNLPSNSGLNPDQINLIDVMAEEDELVVEKLLKSKKIDLNFFDNTGLTPLMQAAKEGKIALINLFLGFEPKLLEQEDSLKRTALNYAAYFNQTAAVKILLDAGANINHQSDRGHSALIDAVKKDYPELTKLLLTRGAEINLKTSEGKIAADFTKNDAIKEMLNQKKSEIKKNNTKKVPVKIKNVWHAIPPEEIEDEIAAQPIKQTIKPETPQKTSQEKIVKSAELLQAEEKSEIVKPITLEKQLFAAVKSGDLNLLSQILTRITPNIRDENGVTPLLFAIESGQVGAIIILLERADPNMACDDNIGNTPLIEAVKDSVKSSDLTTYNRAEIYREISQLLIEHGAKINAKDKSGFDALYYAKQNSSEIADLIIQKTPKKIVAKKTARIKIPEIQNGENAALAQKKLRTYQVQLINSINLPANSSVQAEENNMTIARRILEEEKIDPNFLYDDSSPLMQAAAKGNIEMTKLLLANKIFVDFQDNAGRTALIYAAIAGNEDSATLHSDKVAVAELLIRAGADVNANSKDRRTALMYASDAEMAELLLENGASPFAKSVGNKTALDFAKEKGRENIVKLLEKYLENSPTENNENQDQLIEAAAKGDLKLLPQLIKKFDINKIGKNKLTPLIAAVTSGAPEVVELLLKSGANANLAAEDEIGKTALIEAVHKCSSKETVEGIQAYKKIIKLLLENGANVDQKDKDNLDAFFFAKDNPEVNAMLQLKKAEIAFLEAAKTGDEKTVKNLIKKNKLNLNLKNSGKTALIHAAAGGFEEIVAALLKENANPNIIEDIGGDTALNYAVAGNYINIANLLLKNGADPEIANFNAVTALIQAQRRGYKEMEELIKNSIRIKPKSATEATSVEAIRIITK